MSEMTGKRHGEMSEITTGKRHGEMSEMMTGKRHGEMSTYTAPGKIIIKNSISLCSSGSRRVCSGEMTKNK